MTHLHPDLYTVQWNTKRLIERRFGDIERRLELGIYATEQDETAEQVHARIRVLTKHQNRNSTAADYAQVDALVSELVRRKYFE